MSEMPAMAARRPSLRLVVEGLAARDELLLKSLVRLLDHRTRHQWTFDAVQCDLKVVGEEVAPSRTTLPDARAPGAVLRAGRAASSSGLDLTLPLHPDELERVLNRAGAAIVEARLAEAGHARAVTDDDQGFQLTRWPPTELLRGPGRLALATLLISRPCTVGQLHLRGCAERSACIAFLNELQRAQLLKSTQAGVAATPLATAPAASQPGLFARIRRRLGLLSSTTS